MRFRQFSGIAVLVTLLQTPHNAAAQALRTTIEGLRQAQVAEHAASTYHEILFSPVTTGILLVAIGAALYAFSQGNKRSGLFLGLLSVAIVICRFVTDLIKSPVDFALYVVLPLFMIAFILRLTYSFKKSDDDDDDRKDRVRERRPRTIKVRGVASDDDDEELERKHKNAPVKLNRPFG